ncbi:MBL fold metallo-hydrolase, partial [Thioclava sp. BHET1]
MSGAAFSVKVWGARGSLPVSGEAFRHFGGNTTSIVMTCGGRHVLFDAGSGIMPAGKYLRGLGVTEYDLFLTHCHYDHMIGLPYLSPMFDGAARLRIWSGHLSGVMSTRQLIEDFMRAPWFPISPSVCAATLSYRDFSPGHVLSPAEGVVIRTGRLNHPGGAVGYRVEFE